MNTIHIDWSGPLKWPEVGELNGPEDYGVYQVYGPGLIYKRVELLYIGLAGEQTFATRIQQHWQFEHTSDSSQVCIHIGRLLGPLTPKSDVWTEQIKLAESLLIYAHYPPYNRQKDGIASKPELNQLRVLNWGMYRDLFPEVSGERLCKMPDMIHYGSDE